MNISEDTLIDYINGELPPSEVEALEKRLSSDPKLRAELEEVRATTNLIEQAFAEEKNLVPEPHLEKNKSIPATPIRLLPRGLRWTLHPLMLGGLAACMVFLSVPVLIWIYQNPGKCPSTESAGAGEHKMPEPPPVPGRVTHPSADAETIVLYDEANHVDAMVEAEAPVEFAATESPSPASVPEKAHEPDGTVGDSRSSTLAGTRINTTMKDVGAAIGSVTREFIDEQEKEVEQPEFRTDAFDSITPNPFKRVAQHPLSTFSIDVDTASYSVVREHLNRHAMPPAGAVRTEELINYFPYDYPKPDSKETPFKVIADVTEAPWQQAHHLVRVAIQGYEIPWENRPPSNLVFLIDSSGSMDGPNRLPLVKKALDHLITRLDERDRVAVVTYSGSSRVVLPSTTGDNRETIRFAVNSLQSGGSTQGSAGIMEAYRLARQGFIPDGNNRVILCTDGDFNVGVTNRSELVNLIQKEANSGVFISILGFGMGNYKDGTLEELSNKGNGNYAYIDTEREAIKVFSEQIGSTLITIAKDVKIQVEFNPTLVDAYRLIGYENRLLAPEDFNDDKKDAGEIGAGARVTALYEVIPAGTDTEAADLPSVDPLKYQKPAEPLDSTDELLTVKIRYKDPASSKSKLIEHPLHNEVVPFEKTDDNLRLAVSAAGLGILLRNESQVGSLDWPMLSDIVHGIQAKDEGGHRTDLIQLIEKASMIGDNKPRQSQD